MTDSPRPFRVRRVLLTLAVLLCVPFLHGYTNGCSSRIHAVHPQSRACIECTAAQLQAAVADTRSEIASTQQGGEGVQGVTIMGLTNWDALELCFLENEFPPEIQTVEPLVIVQTQTHQVGPFTLRCYYDFRPLAAQLDEFVAPATLGGEELNVLVQIAPIFTAQVHVPIYLTGKPFADSEVVDSFKLLWDRVSRVLAQPKYDGAQFVIGVGNEVNHYLNDPNQVGHPLTNPVPNSAAAFQAFLDYGLFLASVIPHIEDTQATCPNSNPSCTGETLVVVPRVTGVTTTWFWGCGLGESGNPLCSPDGADHTNLVRGLNGGVGSLIFTYYPSHEYVDDVMAYFSLAEEPAVDLVVAYDMSQMMAEHQDAVDLAGYNKLVFLQEANLVSNRDTQGFNGNFGPTFGANELDRQEMFVDAVFHEWSNQPDAKLNLRAVSVFAMHDFSTRTSYRFPVVPCSSGADCQVFPLAAVDLACEGNICVGKNCTDDTDCSGGLICCLNSQICATPNRCTLPSTCATVTPPGGTVCANGDGGVCPTGHVCNSAHRCVLPKARALFCSYGMQYEEGSSKNAWPTFVSRSQSFDPGTAP